MLAISSETVKPMPETTARPTRTGQVSVIGSRPGHRSATSRPPSRMPSGLPTTYPKKMPSVMGEPTASRRRSPSMWIPMFASANSGTITKLVHGCSRYWSRSLGEIAAATPS